MSTNRQPQGSVTYIPERQLQRHGARYPTSGATERILVALRKLLSVKYTDKRLRFLYDFKYELGSDDLVSFGADQYVRSGYYLTLKC